MRWWDVRARRNLLELLDHLRYSMRASRRCCHFIASTSALSAGFIKILRTGLFGWACGAVLHGTQSSCDPSCGRAMVKQSAVEPSCSWHQRRLDLHPVIARADVVELRIRAGIMLLRP